MLGAAQRRLPGRPGAVACGAVLLLAACTSGPGSGEQAGPVPACPATAQAEPDPNRPRVDLEFRLADDLRTVTGTEKVAFTPDLPIEDVWFRLIPNAPQSAGNELRVDGVRGEDVIDSGYVAAAADPGTPGGLYRVGLRDPVAAGQSVELELDFTLRLTTGPTPAGFDRFGVHDDVTWWASGFPLLTWEPGHGWARDPFVAVSAETTAATVADTTIRVSAPQDLVVLMTGDQAAPRDAGNGRRVWASHEPVSRDVSVAAGRFGTASVTVGATRVTTGVLPGAHQSAEDLADGTARAIRMLEQRFGPFPYRTLTVPLVDRGGGGEEYSSSILMGDVDFELLIHEVAHMWFFGLVGDSQFRDPWLDEGFATYAESVIDTPDEDDVRDELAQPGQVGGTMADFRSQNRYETLVYDKGSAALWAAREAAGPAAFDEAVRCYIDTVAWKIARPEDVARALADLPAALEVLVRAGALDRQAVQAAAD
jgi:Peptidase family M1 domain